MHHEFSLQVTVTDTERPCYAFCLLVVSLASTVQSFIIITSASDLHCVQLNAPLLSSA